MRNNNSPAVMSPTEIAQMLQEEWLGGQGRVTQLPGEAHTSTRKFYNTHKGYDFGVNAGTPLYAPGSVEVLSAGEQGGYGNRLAVYDPQKNRTTYLSHLSNIVVQPGQYQQGTLLGYTGGIPGTPGAGNTTGAHLDIEYYTGRSPFNSTPQAQQAIPQVSGENYAQQLFNIARQRFGGNVAAISSNPDRLKEYADKGYQIKKFTI